MIDLTQCVVGVDLGDRKSLACVYAQGVVVRWFEFEMTREAVQAAFEGKGYLRVALEAGAQSGWVSRLLESLGYLVFVANPRKLKAISANERKSDRNDALMLAKLVWADPSLLHPIQHRSEARDLALTVLTARDAAVGSRTRLINTIRSMAKAAGVRLKRGSAQSFALRAAEVPSALAPAVTGLFSVLATVNEQIDVYDQQLTEMLEKSFPEAQRVNQVRGVGPVTSLAFVLTLETPERFPNGRTAAAFLGLAPRRDQSGAVDRQLRISKTGSNLARRLLVQCAQYILGPLGRDCDLRRWGHKLMERGGKSAKKRAIVATARKLAVLLFRLWKTGEVWKPLHNAPVENVSENAEVTPSSTDEKRPDPAVSGDCVNSFDPGLDPEGRRIDCSTGRGSDSIMHRASRGPSKSADRSVGPGTVSSAKKEEMRLLPGDEQTAVVPVATGRAKGTRKEMRHLPGDEQTAVVPKAAVGAKGSGRKMRHLPGDDQPNAKPDSTAQRMGSSVVTGAGPSPVETSVRKGSGRKARTTKVEDRPNA